MSRSEQPLVLHTGAVEYVTWRVYGLPASPPVGSVQVSADRGASWRIAELVDGAGVDEVRVLVAHPAAVDPDPSAWVLPQGRNELLVRFSDTPEVVVRTGGSLWVV